MTSTYCSPCIADLALVREAVTSVAGTASCMAHAVLLTHSSDDPGRRRQRLDALRDLAAGKAETAEPSEQVKLELLVQEYGLAGAMDMGGPARRQGGQLRGNQHAAAPAGPGGQQHGHAGPTGEERRPKSRRGRGRGEGQPGQGQPGQGQPGQGQPGQGQPGQGQPGQGESRRDRRAGAAGATGHETAPVTPAPGPAGEGAPAVQPSPAAAPSTSADAAPSAPADGASSAPADGTSGAPVDAASAGAALSVPGAGPASPPSPDAGSSPHEGGPPAAAPSAPVAPTGTVEAGGSTPAPSASEPTAPAPAPVDRPADLPVPPTSAPDA